MAAYQILRAWIMEVVFVVGRGAFGPCHQVSVHLEERTLHRERFLDPENLCL